MSARYRQADGTSSGTLPDGGIVVLGPDGVEALVLNATGAVVWEMCDGARDGPGIATFICDTLPDADRAFVSEDIARFIEDLRRRGLIVEVP